MSQEKSPFKFLDPYKKEDQKIFFGRDEEIDQLYKMVFETNLILVYGESGTGKTSLIQCGLASRFEDSDWYEIFVRRKGDINRSLRTALQQAAQTTLPEEYTLAEAVESIFLDYFKPIFLIFDQFEELFIEGMGRPKEREEFIHSIRDLLKADLKCRIIFVIREEYLAKLYDFEKVVPNLFAKRLRIEPMGYGNVRNVVERTCEEFGIQLEDQEKTIDAIIDKISEGRSGIQLSYLQIYLDRLYQNAENQ